MVKKWRSISIDEKIYVLVAELQQKLIKENNNEHIQIGIVAEAIILAGIDKVILKNGKVDVKEE